MQKCFHKTEYGEGRYIMYSALSLPALEKLLPGFESSTRRMWRLIPNFGFNVIKTDGLLESHTSMY